MGPAAGQPEGVQGAGHQHSRGAGHINNFLAVWVRNIILVDRMREHEMVAGDWMRMDKWKGGELPADWRNHQAREGTYLEVA